MICPRCRVELQPPADPRFGPLTAMPDRTQGCCDCAVKAWAKPWTLAEQVAYACWLLDGCPKGPV